MLKELYHGKINRSERSVQANPNQEWLKLSAEFEKTLSLEQLEMYRDLSDMQSEKTSDDEEMLYIQGFKDGALMMLEILSE
ncbi:MAG: hypothetical protein V3G42_15665 [Oscillospiraceae bacterium]